MLRVFKITVTRGGKKVKSAEYYGKLKLAPGRWSSKIKLFVDKSASERRLRDLQQQNDRRAAGVLSVESERLELPLRDLLKLYVTELRRRGMKAEHCRLTEWMTGRLIELGGWDRFNDVTHQAVERVLETLEAGGATASYRNKFITRAKAFVRWALPEGHPNPLGRLRRIRERGARRTRERRPASLLELQALFGVGLPAHRVLAYALAAFNGLRRNEAARLTWEHVNLSAPIPFLGLERKQGDDDTRDYVPIHPYVLTLIVKLTSGDAGVRVLPSVPDMKTVAKDLLTAGIAKEATQDELGVSAKGQRINIADARGRRLDFHALRHTFSTMLDHAGCSRATKKKLMRHANEDVTDGYAHAELGEMLAAMVRIPSPLTWGKATSIVTGSPAEAAAGSCRGVDHPQDQAVVSPRRLPSRCGAESRTSNAVETDGFPGETAGQDASCLPEAPCDLPKRENPAIVRKTRPSTQVDQGDGLQIRYSWVRIPPRPLIETPANAGVFCSPTGHGWGRCSRRVRAMTSSPSIGIRSGGGDWRSRARSGSRQRPAWKSAAGSSRIRT